MNRHEGNRTRWPFSYYIHIYIYHLFSQCKNSHTHIHSILFLSLFWFHENKFFYFAFNRLIRSNDKFCVFFFFFLKTILQIYSLNLSRRFLKGIMSSPGQNVRINEERKEKKKKVKIASVMCVYKWKAKRRKRTSELLLLALRFSSVLYIPHI